jgi:glycosyltransferase involved in cell wall biosynthesis
MEIAMEATAPFLALIPVYNEAMSLPRVIAELRGSWPGIAIVVLDDGSEDRTDRVVRELNVRCIRLREHLGLGNAIRAGIRYAHRRGYTIVVRLDGDGQHHPAQIQQLLEPIWRGEADAVQGSRYSGSSGFQPSGLRRVAQRALAALLSCLTGQPVTDPTSGFWGFGPRAIELLAEHHPTGYPEPELRLLLHRNFQAVVEVPVEMRPRLAGRTTLNALQTALAFARILLVAVVVPLRPRIEPTP